MAKNKKKKKTGGIAAALWFLAVLVVLVIGLAKKDEILTNIKQVQVFERLFHTTPDFIKNHEGSTELAPKKNKDEIKIDVEPFAPKAEVKTENKAENIPETKAEQKKEVKIPESSVPPKNAVAEKKPSSETEKNKTVKNESSRTETKQESKYETKAESVKPETKPAVAPTFNAILYFVEIDGDGRVNLKSVQRSIKKTDSPLTEVLGNLLSGPNYSEKTKGAMSCIPEGTRLIGASVKNGVATLNFSEEFQFNTLGVEGYLAQLKQIIYTATTFSTVNSVQFMIEGQKSDYLGSEGVWIGSPLGR